MLDKTARFMFALIMIGFGINYFYPVIYPKLESAGTFFLLALDRTNYMMPMIKSIEMLVAILFLLSVIFLSTSFIGLLKFTAFALSIYCSESSLAPCQPCTTQRFGTACCRGALRSKHFAKSLATGALRSTS